MPLERIQRLIHVGTLPYLYLSKNYSPVEVEYRRLISYGAKPGLRAMHQILEVVCVPLAMKSEKRIVEIPFPYRNRHMYSCYSSSGAIE
jgi:hypothetical protein